MLLALSRPHVRRSRHVPVLDQSSTPVVPTSTTQLLCHQATPSNAWPPSPRQPALRLPRIPFPTRVSASPNHSVLLCRLLHSILEFCFLSPSTPFLAYAISPRSLQCLRAHELGSLIQQPNHTPSIVLRTRNGVQQIHRNTRI